MTFNESNTVEAFIRDLLCGGITHHTVTGPGLARRNGKVSGLGWHFIGPNNFSRQSHEVLDEPALREALIRLNPTIAAQPDRADEVLHKLRAIVMTVRSPSLAMATWDARLNSEVSALAT